MPDTGDNSAVQARCLINGQAFHLIIRLKMKMYLRHLSYKHEKIKGFCGILIKCQFAIIGELRLFAVLA